MAQYRMIPMGPEKNSVGSGKIRAEENRESTDFHTPENEDQPIPFLFERRGRLSYIDQLRWRNSIFPKGERH